MQPTREIQAFIERVNALPAGPGVSLDDVLQPSLNEEAELRKLFATDRKNPILADPHVGLVDVFDAPASIRTIRARVVKDKEDLSAKYVMPISDDARRKEGSPAMVADLEEFKKNWAIFTEGSLSQLFDWNNVIAAGGSVLACLTPLEEEDKVSKRAIRKFYHSNAYPTSDVDLFLWGLTPEQAEAKIKTIYEAVRDSVPWDVTCIRTKHTVSIHSQYPYRSVQIVLRLYQSPAEILAGFDIDAPCCAYDGDRVWANPRAVVAMMRQCNTVDMTRRSPSYEIRLAKYSQRAFEVYVPNLKRNEIDPTIYERSIARMEGLARLLVLEKLKDDNMRNAFIEGRRQLRGRPTNYNRQQNRRNRRKYKGDLKAEIGMGVEMNDYDVASLHIPYGPGWDARRIDKLVYQTDLGMNSTFNPKNKGRRLHRHPAFFGTVEEVMEDCCEMCPKPVDDDERELQKEEDEVYIRGRIEFIQENPGRQSISGSFNPIDEGEWSEQVYVKPTQQLFIAVAAHDRAAVQKLLKEGIDVNQRDHVGRTSLHVAIFSKAMDIACDLINGGARISARLSDGRNALHLAAQYDQLPVIQKLMERNAKNKADAEKKEKGEDDDAMDSQDEHPERNSSEDDWSSHEDDDVDMVDADDEDDDEDEDDDDDDEEGGKKAKSKKTEPETTKGDSGDIPEEEEDQPDIIVIDELDWDLGFSALSYAILFASLPTLEALLDAGADIHVVTKSSNVQDGRFQPLTLCILREDEDEACAIAERLIKAGASSSTADDQMRTVLHVAVFNGRTKLVETLLRCDPNAKKVVNFPALVAQHVMFPIVTAINKKHYGLVALLLAHDAKLDLDEKDITPAQEAAKPEVRRMLTMYGEVDNYVHLAYQPLETAIANHDDLSKLLAALGTPVDIGILQCLSRYPDLRSRRTIREYIDFTIDNLSVEIERLKKEQEEADAVEVANEEQSKEETGWLGYYRKCQRVSPAPTVSKEQKEREAKRKQDKLDRHNDILDFFIDLRNLIKTENPKTWRDVYPSLETQADANPTPLSKRPFRNTLRRETATDKKGERNYTYAVLSNTTHDNQTVPEHTVPAYDELFEACFAGDNDKVQRLCLPVEGQGTFATSGAPGPLNISVRMIPRPSNRFDQNGYTPLFAAVAGRQWSTAKLVLAIATAQYHPDDEDDKIKFDPDVDMDSDSDDESIHSNDSDMTVEQQEVKFIDIAKRPSAVQVNIHPKKMLEVRAHYRKPVTTPLPTPVATRTGPFALGAPFGGLNFNHFTPYPLMKAVIDHDLEAFVHIAKLYEALTPTIPLNSDLLDVIIQQDQPDILDEYIRRTGAGIKAGSEKEPAFPKDGESDVPIATNDANRIYYGLNVHGKKRMDLARKNDPNAGNSNEKAEVPLVWQAARDRAKDILNYLASDRPLAAYKFYAMSHSDAKAIWLRRMSQKDTVKAPGEAEKKLAVRLGWTINSLGESPLSSALLGRDVETVKVLFKLQSALMNQALQTKIKFIGFNPLLLAVRLNCEESMMDYLLSRNISPAERDLNRGWNIYHHICELNNGKLLQYFLKKLPRDLNEELLNQPSYKRLNTPMHVLVKKSNKDLLKILLEYSTSTILLRDVDGQTPLHCAVNQSRAAMTELLLSASPNATEALFMENSVGNTPAELCALKKITERVNNFALERNIYTYNVTTINPSIVPSVDPPRFTANAVEKIEEQLRLVRDVVGRYGGPSGTARLNGRVWSQWVERTEEALRSFQEKLKREEEERKKEMEKQPQPLHPAFQVEGTADTGLTLKHIQEALKKLSASGTLDNRRHLVHLLDVQKSVSATLEKVSGQEEDYGNTRGVRVTGYRRKRNRVVGSEGALDGEEDAGAQERRMSMIFQQAGTGPDIL